MSECFYIIGCAWTTVGHPQLYSPSTDNDPPLAHVDRTHEIRENHRISLELFDIGIGPDRLASMSGQQGCTLAAWDNLLVVV